MSKEQIQIRREHPSPLGVSYTAVTDGDFSDREPAADETDPAVFLKERAEAKSADGVEPAVFLKEREEGKSADGIDPAVFLKGRAEGESADGVEPAVFLKRRAGMEY